MNLVEKIKRNRKTGVPTFIFGAPGVGKSQMVHQAADGDTVIDVRLSMLDPVDLRGLPTVKQNGDGESVVEWARPEFIPAEGKGIIFFDELNTAPAAVQNAALQIILDRKCGPHKLGDGWYIVAAGNKASHKAHVNPLSAPLRNRFAVVEYEPSVEAWSAWAMGAGVHDHVIGFLNFRPGLLTTDPKDEYANFASPRSWDRVSKFLQAGLDEQEDMEPLVGKGAAAEFTAYRTEIRDMPDIDALIAKKAEFKENPKKISISYAVAMALASRLSRGDKKFVTTNADRCCEIVSALSPEIACLFFVRTLTSDPHVKTAVCESKSAHKWVLTHEKLLTKYGIKK
jgi:hypothetical protein